jgi:hypothetical protein
MYPVCTVGFVQAEPFRAELRGRVAARFPRIRPTQIDAHPESQSLLATLALLAAWR